MGVWRDKKWIGKIGLPMFLLRLIRVRLMRYGNAFRAGTM
jgi:hypothetical protein